MKSENKKLFTTFGPKTIDELQYILPHEHIFVDQRMPDVPGYGQADTDDVVRLMAPEVEAVKAFGVSVIVECTPAGVGRRVDFTKAVSEATGLPLVVATGVYREPWIPKWMHMATEAVLARWMTHELLDGVEDTGVKAAWIKLSAGNEGLTDCERKVLRAAARAGAETGAVIGSHTIKGDIVREQADIIERAGYALERFIWIHTQKELDFAVHLEMARRGVWIEYDNIGSGIDDILIEWILKMLDAGYEKQLLLSQDRGWYTPAKPGGGIPKPFTYIMQDFLPKLIAAGVDRKTVDMLMHDNPYNAYAR